jgi:UDP-glucuronate decarboxylase
MSHIINEDSEIIFKKINFYRLENKTIIITGASGLIGTYFLACLRVIANYVKGIKVVAIIQSEPSKEFLDIANFKDVRIIQTDITKFDFYQQLPEADYIIHAAGYGQPMKFMTNPEKTLMLNTSATFHLFHQLNSGGRFLFISSSEVYSGLKATIYKEEDIGISNTTHPRACYIEGKRAGEAICNAYREKGIQAFSARLAHTYGPSLRTGDQRVIMSFIEKALNGKIELMDQGTAIRTYCYISDAVEIMWNILLFGTEPIYNVAGHSRTSIGDLAKTIGSQLNVPVVFPENNDSISGAPEDVQLDTSKAENEFKKKDYVSLADGLKRTINWYKQL